MMILSDPTMATGNLVANTVNPNTTTDGTVKYNLGFSYETLRYTGRL